MTTFQVSTFSGASITCVFALLGDNLGASAASVAVKPGVYFFLTASDALPELDLEQLENLKASGLFAHHLSFQKQLSSTKGSALLFTATKQCEESEVLVLFASLLNKNEKELRLAPFAQTAKSLSSGAQNGAKNGEHRRVLQLAVQYLAAGGIDDSLLAAEYDWDFLQKIREDLEKKDKV